MAEAAAGETSFQQTWRSPTGFPGVLSEVNNQPLGKRYVITAFVFFLLGGVLSLLLRTQLAVSNNNFLGPEVYNQIFTMHGSTMMYLFAVPFLEGMALYLLPLMIGARDVAYPRLTAFGYWCYLFGGILFYAGFVLRAAPDAGWFAYTPLSGPAYTGLGSDIWVLGLGLVEIAGITAAVEIVVTILKFRAPGMSLSRMPLYVWAMLVSGVMILFAFTVLLAATVLLELDRTAGTRFFDPDAGGSSLLWQHLFWFFGHPEVYIMFIPATGIVSMVVATFARRAVVGYTLIAVAILVTGFLSFGLWVHHMFATGLPELSKTFFTAASLLIAVASGTQVFAWIATLWGSRPDLQVPLLFVLGFLFLFVLGGLTGVMVAVVPFDLQVHDTYFVVAHFHYVLIGGVVFPIYAGIHYWLPKVTGRMLSRAMGLWSFWLAFVGFNLSFFPMHWMGFLGMPRRVYTYPPLLGLDAWNIVATVGAFLMAAGFALILIDVLLSLRRGRPSGDNPWNAKTLEWSVSSPPPAFSFGKPPVVLLRRPLRRGSDDIEPPEEFTRASAALDHKPEGWRATLVTDSLDARPQAIQWLPGPTYVPLYTAIGLLIAAVSVLARAYILAGFGAVVTVAGLIAWLYPRAELLAMLRSSEVGREAGLSIPSTGYRSTSWWAALGLVTVLGMVYAALVYSYFYIRMYSEVWPQNDLPLPELEGPGFGYALLGLSALGQFLGSLGFRRGNPALAIGGLASAVVLGLAFLAVQLTHLAGLPFGVSANAYGSLFIVISATLAGTVGVGIAILVAAILRLRHDHADRDGFMALQIQITEMYWYFTVAAAGLVFATLFLSPRAF